MLLIFRGAQLIGQEDAPVFCATEHKDRSKMVLFLPHLCRTNTKQVGGVIEGSIVVIYPPVEELLERFSLLSLKVARDVVLLWCKDHFKRASNGKEKS